MLSSYGNRKQQEPFPPAGLLPTRDKKFPVLESDRPVGNVLDGPWTDGPMGLRAALLLGCTLFDMAFPVICFAPYQPNINGINPRVIILCYKDHNELLIAYDLA